MDAFWCTSNNVWWLFELYVLLVYCCICLEYFPCRSSSSHRQTLFARAEGAVAPNSVKPSGGGAKPQPNDVWTSALWYVVPWSGVANLILFFIQMSFYRYGWSSSSTSVNELIDTRRRGRSARPRGARARPAPPHRSSLSISIRNSPPPQNGSCAWTGFPSHAFQAMHSSLLRNSPRAPQTLPPSIV